jgi:outer membrane protein assembly factor BamA
MKPFICATGTLVVLFLFLPSSLLMSAEEGEKEAKVKTHTLGLLPYGRYSDDQGFGFGVVVQWDDKRSLEYQPYYLSHRISIEYTTRGIQDYGYRLDSKYLLPANLRLTFKTRYVISLFEPYHGPGGAQTLFNQDFIDVESPDFRGDYYYMYDKRYLEISGLVQGSLKGAELRWLTGLVALSTTIDTINYADYEEADPGETLLRHHWSSLGADSTGGLENGLVAGIVWDRRDHEMSPHQGFWSEALIRWVPDMLGNDYSYMGVIATHRHYVPLSDAFTFAVRVSGRITTEGAPFFTIPRVEGSFVSEMGLGGNKTIRGVLWQRASGRNFIYGNLEPRYHLRKLFKTGYIAASGFYDFGRTFDEEPASTLFDKGDETDRLHQGIGIGLRLAPSDTFILALDLGFPIDGDLDGPGLKVYMGLDWLF